MKSDNKNSKKIYINKNALSKISEGLTELLYGILTGEDSPQQEIENDNSEQQNDFG